MSRSSGGMSTYFDTIGRIDPFDVIGLPSFVPRLSRIGVGPVLRFFDSAVDDITAEILAEAA